MCPTLYDGDDRVSATDAQVAALDPDISAGNIKKDVAIFGVTGAYEAALVPKTGQTSFYATGDDGDLEKGVSWPSPRFTDNIDGTVTDNLTGLIWLKKANYNSTGGSTGTATWANALSFCNALHSEQCGLSDGSSAGDWRLPNRFELESLLDMSQHGPALPSGNLFTGVQSYRYWASATNAYYSTNAWYVYLNYGYVSYDGKAYTHYVWPVRGGQ